jgi:glycosyltransferase involved in cell wall biosynthesis
MADLRLRVALDLSGPPEPLGNWVELLAAALRSADLCDVTTFVTGRGRGVPVDAHIIGRAVWRSQWYRGTGRKVDRALPNVDLVHVTGRATPPTKAVPLLVSVDDLRPLRDDSRGRQRVAQLRRVVARGAQIVASSRVAGLEVQRTLGLDREQVVSVAPAVSFDQTVVDGEDLVVHVTGATDRFLEVAPALVDLVHRQHSRIVVLASREAGNRIRQAGLGVTVRHRADARAVLLRARIVVHLSDGARFPSFVAAALAAGVPTCASSTAVNRELLEGASVLVDELDDGAVAVAVEDLWGNESRRAVLIAAGRARAADYSPAVAARQYAALYAAMSSRVVHA